MSESALRSAAQRAARTRAQRAAAGAYSGARRTAAEAAAARAEAGEATLDEALGPSVRTFGPMKRAHRDAAGRAYKPAGEEGTFFFRLPPGGDPPQPDEVLVLAAPAKGAPWRARVDCVFMDAGRRRCTGVAVLRPLGGICT